MGIVRQLARRVMAGILPRRRFVIRGGAASGGVALTFDDGPHPEHTPALLDQLRTMEVPATFFLVGERVRQWPEVVRRIGSEGHEIGHHSYSHSAPETTSCAVLMDEIRMTAAAFRSAGLDDSRLVRPPHGKLTAAKLAGIWRLGKGVVLWNVDPKDFAMASGEDLRRWADSWQPAGGDIVLLHDNHPWAAGALDRIVEQVRGAGLGFTTAGRMAGYGA